MLLGSESIAVVMGRWQHVHQPVHDQRREREGQADTGQERQPRELATSSFDGFYHQHSLVIQRLRSAVKSFASESL